MTQPTRASPTAHRPVEPTIVERNGVFLGFLALAAGLLIAEHRVHVLGALPWLILLACPLMHLFMHRGHSHGAHGHHEEERK